MAYEAGQPYAAAVQARHAFRQVEQAQHGVVGGDPQVAPQRQLHASAERSTLDGGNHRLGQMQPRRSQRRGAVRSEPVKLNETSGCLCGLW